MTSARTATSRITMSWRSRGWTRRCSQPSPGSAGWPPPWSGPGLSRRRATVQARALFAHSWAPGSGWRRGAGWKEAVGSERRLVVQEGLGLSSRRVNVRARALLLSMDESLCVLGGAYNVRSRGYGTPNPNKRIGIHVNSEKAPAGCRKRRFECFFSVSTVRYIPCRNPRNSYRNPFVR